MQEMHPLLVLVQAGCTPEEIAAFAQGRAPRQPPTSRARARALLSGGTGAHLSAAGVLGPGVEREPWQKGPTDAELVGLEERWHSGEDMEALAQEAGLDVESFMTRLKRIHRSYIRAGRWQKRRSRRRGR